MVKNSIKKLILFPIIILFALSMIGSFFLFLPTKENSSNYFDTSVAKLIEKYSAGKKVVKTIDDEYLTEENEQKININDFCTFTGTKYSEDDTYINLTYGDFSVNINKANNYIVTTDGNVVYLEENENDLYSIDTLATNLGFQISNKNDITKLTRPYQTKRVIVEANGKFDPVGAIEVVHCYDNTYLLQFTTETEAKQAIKELNLQKSVNFAEPNIIVGLDDDIESHMFDLNETSNTFLSWGGEMLGIDDYKTYLQSAVGENNLDTITVAVLDTGIDTDHPMFAGRISKYSHNFVDSNNPNDPEDDHGHGTHVAGIICDLTYSNVQILALKVLDGEGYGEIVNIGKAINFAQDLKESSIPDLAVINMSLGADIPVDLENTGYTSQKNAIEGAYADGILTVTSAGNGDDDGNAIDVSNNCPANIGCAITVGAVGIDSHKNYYIGSFSNFGSYVDISAPGISIVSAATDGTTTTKTGTSMAAPHISAVVTLLLSDKTMEYETLAEVEDALKFYTVDAGSEGWDEYYGVGIPDLTYAHCDRLEPVTFSNENTKCSEPFELTLTHTNAEANVKILYTLDGQTPTAQNSTIYENPITISTSTTVKAIACVLYEGSITKCSKITQMTYQFDFVADEDGYLIEYNGTDSDVIVPETVNGIEIVGIGDYCFETNTTITSVTLPESVTEIGYAAFGYCTNLTKVVAPGITHLNDYAFYNCTSFKHLNDIYFPKLEYISRYSFMYCESITSASLPEVKHIDENAFAYCKTLSSITFNNLLTIGGGAFINCSLLTSATIPACQIVSAQAFKNCRFSSISFPEVVLLGSSVFAGNIHLAAANLPKAIYIGNSCFSSNALDTIIAPNVEIVGRSAFFNCDELTSIDFPKAIRIENAAFANTSLTSINLDSVQLIEGLVFQNVPVANVKFPNLIKIEAHAFSHLDTLKSITFSHCIEEIEPLAINSCTNCVIKGYRNTVAQTYAIQNGYTFSPISTCESDLTYEIVENKEVHITGYLETLKDNAIIPDFIEGLPVTTIKENAFKGCTKITKLQSSTITLIEPSAFENCINLTTIILPKLTDVANAGFKGCTNLTSVTIENIEDIGAFAFNGCLSLESFTFTNPSTSVGEKAFGFDGETKIDTFVIFCYEGTKVEQYATDNEFTYHFIAQNLSGYYYGYYTTSEGNEEIYIAFVSKTINGEIVLPETYKGYTVSAVGQYAFEDCSFITKVTLPSTYQIIDTGAFSSCALLESINLENVKQIGDFAFEYCYRLKEIDLKNTIYLGESAFYYCANLETANIPKLTEIKAQTFYACSKLHTIKGDNIANIGEWAFWQTKKLTNINLKNARNIQAGLCVAFEEMYLPSIEILGDHALNSNNQLLKLVINKSITSIGLYAIPRIGANTTVYGYADTVAETYTTENEIKFVAIEDLSIKTDLEYRYDFDNASPDTKLNFVTTGFDVNYVWYKNTEQTKFDCDIVKDSSENFYLVDKLVVEEFFIYCTATDWKDETVSSVLTYVVVTYNVYYTVTTTAYGNGSISPEGVVSIKEGAAATFYFFPETGYEISSVIVDGNNIGKATSQKFPTMTKNHTIVVYFSIIELTITASTNDYGTITPSGDENGEIFVDYGEEITFYFTPIEGYKLSYVTVNGTKVNVDTSNNSYTFIMPTRDYFIVAYFEIIVLEVNIVSDGGIVNPYGKVLVEYGDPLIIELANTVDKQITKVLQNGEVIALKSSNTELLGVRIEQVKENLLIEIITIPHPYFVSVKTGENGSAESRTVVANYDETAVVNLIPDAGYRVSKLFLDGEEIEPSNTIEFTNICSDHEISAEFDLIVYKISFDLGGFGEIVETEGDTATYGENRTYTIKTNPLYQIDKVYVNGKKVNLLEGNKISLKDISDDFNIQVTFKKNLSVPIMGIVFVAIVIIIGVVILLYVKRRLKLEHRKRTNLTTMLHTSKKTDVKTIKIKDEFLLDDDDDKPRRKRSNKKS